MALRDTVRIYVRDNGTTQRFTADDIDLMMQQAADTLNSWRRGTTTYAVSSGDIAPVLVAPVDTALFLLLCKLEGLLLDLQDVKRYAKFVTQDIQYDPSEIASRLNRTYTLVAKDIDNKVRKWIGIDSGIALTHVGEIGEA